MKNGMLQVSLLSLLIALFTMSATSCGKKNRDGEIQSAIATKTQTDPNFAGVSATVVDGTVTLTGNCADENCRTNAEKQVKGIEGVKKVVNNIMIAEVQVADDAQLRQSVEQAVDKYDGVQASVSGGIVTLRGTIDDREDLQQLMMDLNALRPRRVDNQLVIKN